VPLSSINFVASEGLREELRAAARRLDRSQSWIMRQALLAYLMESARLAKQADRREPRAPAGDTRRDSAA
jgi:predicted transcriptional regulator